MPRRAMPLRLDLLLLAAALAACGGGASEAPPPAPFCAAGATRPCYSGPAGTDGVGACRPGIQVCSDDGAAWGACGGEVVPRVEVCGNLVDDDCDGAVDQSADQDGDGWAGCGGDCDDAAPGVNPGAFDVPGNGVDDDCDGTVDGGAAAGCSAAAKLDGVTGADLAQALDLCQSTTVNPPTPQERRWGLLSARLALADGTGAPDPLQVGVLSGFGPNVQARSGATMAVLSTGSARTPADPGFVSPFAGLETANASPAPADLLAAYGGDIPHDLACVSPPGPTVYDPVRLELTLRAPTNARGLSIAYRFYAADHSSYSCTGANDVFALQVYSAAAGLPAGNQVAFGPGGGPVTVNGGLITSCTAGPAPGQACPEGTAALVGTGYLGATGLGGASGWRVATSPVIGGETVVLAFTIWDSMDHVSDSLVLLDALTWHTEPTAVTLQRTAP